VIPLNPPIDLGITYLTPRRKETMKAEFSLVAVPRKWVKDWFLNLLIVAFGHSVAVYQPLRWILMRDITARERETLCGDSSI